MKKLLLSIFVLGLSFLSFSNATSYTVTGSASGGTPVGGSSVFYIPLRFDFSFSQNSSNNYPDPGYTFTCTYSNVSFQGVDYLNINPQVYGMSTLFTPTNAQFGRQYRYNVTTDGGSFTTEYTENFKSSNIKYLYGIGMAIYNASSVTSYSFDWSCVVSGDRFLGESVCPACPEQYTSEECQSVYGLVTSGTLNACQSDLESCQSFTNGFNQQLNNCNSSLNACNSSLTSCLQSNCPETSGDVAWSNIYVNDILFPGKPLVNILIPDYITWDYTGSDVSFDVYVGSGYDVDYINSIVDINSYRPGSEDFTNIFVGGLTLIFPYIFVALLILFIWKLVKRIFK